MAPKKSGMSVADIEKLITQRVTEALTAQDSNRDGGNSQNSDTNNFSGGERTTRVCTYKDFLNCQPLNFKGTEWTVGLAHWFEKMEYMFHIRNCTVGCQVKYATCTLLGGTLTWWNSHVRNVGHDAAYVMPWKTLMKMVIKNYYPRKLIPLCSRMVPDESDNVEKYTGGLLDKGFYLCYRQAENKRRMDNNSRSNHDQKPPYKRQNVARLMLLGLAKRESMLKLYPCATSVSFTIMGHALQCA
ncbi:hypothetical protein Tco_1550754 [Tanacetum coccineum]